MGTLPGREACQSSPIPKRTGVGRVPLPHTGISSESPPPDCWALESSVVALRLPEVILPPLSQFLKMDVMWLRGVGSESSNSQRGC